jgi:hypothetical protein
VLEEFLELSELLVGQSGLGQALADPYMARIRALVPHGQYVDQLITVFKEIKAGGGDINLEIEKRIMTDASLGPLAQQIIFLWYTSALPSVDGKVWDFGSPEEYFSALLWPAIRAHTPGLSGGYFGHWKYAPDN